MKKKGISLIVLIITIVVIIILATTIIVNIAQSNLIDNAKKATFLQDLSNFEDELNLFNGDMYVENYGEYESQLLNADSNSIEYLGQGTIQANNIYDILTSLKGSKYEDIIVIENGMISIDYGKNYDKEIIEWADENNINVSGVKISTREQLEMIGISDEYPLDGRYELANDIDLEGSQTNQWVPIANYGLNTNFVFSGIFDGNNHKIKNIYINNASRYQALFGANSGTIKNIVLENGSITSTYNDASLTANIAGIVSRNIGGTVDNCMNYADITASSDLVGGIASYNDTTANILNCQNFGKIKLITEAEYGCAGIVGRNEGIVEECGNEGIVEGKSQVGGIVGNCDSGSNIIVKKCYNKADVSGTSYVAGIVGAAWNTANSLSCICTISDCYNEGDISSTQDFCAGITGKTQHDITNCYNLGDISGRQYVAGVVGSTSSSIKNIYVQTCYNKGIITASELFVGGIVGKTLKNTNVVNCYNENSVTADRIVGGIVGSNEELSSIIRCYNAGVITANNTTTANKIGGIAGSNYSGIINSCYNIGEFVSHHDYVGGIVGVNYKKETCESGSKISNCYNIKGVSSNVSYVGSISGSNTDSTIENCYYLDTIGVGGINGTDVTGQAISKTQSELKAEGMIALLNATEENFKLDKEFINEGYPILNWK